MSDVTFLPTYFERLDSGGDVEPMLADDFSFSLLWATAEGAREFAGSLDEFRGYLAQRDPDGQLHHIRFGTREGSSEVVSGWTTRYGELLATFVFAVELDGEERATRLFAARTLAFGGVAF